MLLESDQAPRLRWIRIGSVLPGASAWIANVDEGRGQVRVIVEQHSEAGWHLSISYVDRNSQPTRLPSWDEVSDARHKFVPDRVTMAMLLPPREDAVNQASMHLWQIPEEVGELLSAWPETPRIRR